jgi:hypothetical protein
MRDRLPPNLSSSEPKSGSSETTDLPDYTDNSRLREGVGVFFLLTFWVKARSNVTSSTSVFSVNSVVQTAFLSSSEPALGGARGFFP